MIRSDLSELKSGLMALLFSLLPTLLLTRYHVPALVLTDVGVCCELKGIIPLSQVVYSHVVLVAGRTLVTPVIS